METVQETAVLVLQLAAVLQRERQRSRTGHWCYDFNRHKSLASHYRTELERFVRLKLASGQPFSDGYTNPRPSTLLAGAEAHFLGKP